MIGTSISHYEILRKIGEGGMGQVYEARDTLLHRRVALKVLPAERASDPEHRRRFLREARAASGLNHPNIITVHDVVPGEDFDCIVMEYVDGRPLSESLSKEGMEADRVLRYGLQVAEAVATAHAAGIIHRDLKPANVMLTANGGVKVLDFGLAKRETLADSNPDHPTEAEPLTRFGQILGTLDYMSPEQALGQPVDGRSDVFSLGTMLYEMLSGERPFRGTSPASLLHAVAYERPRPLAEARPGLPPELQDLLDRAMASSPEDRFQSMEELAAAMRHALDSWSRWSDAPTLDASHLAPSRTAAAEPAAKRWWRWLGEGRTALYSAIAVLTLALAAVVALPASRRAIVDRLAFRGAGANAVSTVDELAGLGPLELSRRGRDLLERYYRDGNVEAAIESFQRALSAQPEYAAAYAGLGEAYWRKYRAEREPQWLELAANNASRALEIDEQLTAPRATLGLVRIAQRDYESARAELDRTLRLDPANAAALRGLGDLGVRLGAFDEAEKRYLQAIEADPEDQELHGVLGALHYRQGRGPDAAAAFSRSIELAPDNFTGYKNLAAAYHLEGRYAEAAAQLQTALEIQPDPSVYTNLGTLYFFQGLYQEAVIALEKALELGANDYRVWGNLGDAYRWIAGKEQEAVEAHTRAIQLATEELAAAPDDSYLRSLVASYRAKAGDVDAALGELAALESVEGKDYETYYNSIQASEIAGERERALALLAEAMGAGHTLVEIKKDPELAKLRSDPRYHRLLAAEQARQTD